MRKWLSFKLVRLATWLYPESPETTKFITLTMLDAMITSKAITRIDPLELYKDPEAKCQIVSDSLK